MKPILFNTDMVQAILEGRKSVTRRVVKPQPKSKLAYVCMGDGCGKWGYPGKDAWEYWDDESFRLSGDISQDELKRRWTPPCHTDDILYVRETWARSMAGTYLYKATDTPIILDRWRPSIHMPKEAARIFLRVTDVRVERLQEITDKQAMAEGIGAYWILGTGENGYAVSSRSKTLYEGPIGAFRATWNSTIKPADLPIYGWEANPWVWVIEFERISKEVALEGVDEG